MKRRDALKSMVAMAVLPVVVPELPSTQRQQAFLPCIEANTDSVFLLFSHNSFDYRFHFMRLDFEQRIKEFEDCRVYTVDCGDLFPNNESSHYKWFLEMKAHTTSGFLKSRVIAFT